MVQKPEPTSTTTRRFTDSLESFPTVIGGKTTIRGELSGDDAVDMRGTLEGDSRVSAHFSVGAGAHVTGTIEARSLVVGGEVQAPVLTADKIEIGGSARVKASLRARVIAIAEGAVFDGDVHMGGEPGAGPVLFKEQRRSRPEDESA